MEKHHDNHVTLADIAVTLKRVQEWMVTTEALQGLATQADLHTISAAVAEVKEGVTARKETMQGMMEERNATHADVRHVHSTVTMLVRSDAAQDAAITDLIARVHRLEQKVGLVK